MNNERWATAEDGVVFVLAGRGVAFGATLFQTDNFFETEIPTTRSLTEVAGDCAEIANLWCGNRMCRLRQTRHVSAHALVFFKICKGYLCADGESLRVER